MLQLKFNPGLTLTAFRTTRPRPKFNFENINYFCLYLQSKVVSVGKLVSKQTAKYNWIYNCELRLNIALTRCGFGGVSYSCSYM